MSDKINNERRAFRGVWIPAKIWLNKELSLLEKCLLVEINSLDNDDGCFASNEYLAEFLNTSEPTISRAISRLKMIGDLYQRSFNGRQRSLGVKDGLIEPNQNDKAGNQFDNSDKSKRLDSLSILSNSSIDNNTCNNMDIYYKNEYFLVSKDKHEEYKKAFILIDIDYEYGRMKRWLDDNPTRRKTKKGYPRFVSGWLERTNDKVKLTKSKEYEPNDTIRELNKKAIEAVARAVEKTAGTK